MRVTLTLEMSDLREANQKALTQITLASKDRLGAELAQIENFLSSVYRFAVLVVRREHEMKRAAEIWRESLDLFDHAAEQIKILASERPGIHASLGRILEIRAAASDMLALHNPK